MPFNNESGAHYGGLASKFRLPGLMVQHRHWRSGWLVIIGRKQPASEGLYAESREIVSRHVFGSQWLGSCRRALLPPTETPSAGLKRGYFFEFRCRRLQTLIKRKREHPPAILRAA